MKIKRVLLTVLALLLAFTMCFAMVGCDKDDKKDKKSSSSRSPEDVADKFMEAVFIDKKAEDAINLIHDDVIDGFCEEEDMKKSEFEDEFQEDLDDLFEEFDYEYDDWSVDWTISYVEDLEEYNLEDIKDSYSDYYDVEIDDAKLVEIDATLKTTCDGEKEEDTDELEIVAVKIDGKWYLDIESMEDAFY